MIDVPLQRVCIVMMSAVGDAVHVLPVINAIKRQSPRTHITWILQPGPATLVRGHRSVDDIILFDRSRGWRAFTDVRRELAARRFDLVVALQVYFKAGVVTSFTGAPAKLAFEGVLNLGALSAGARFSRADKNVMPNWRRRHRRKCAQFLRVFDDLGFRHYPDTVT